MTQYISKNALVAEIEDWRDKIKKGIFSIPLTGSDRAYATFEYEILGKVRDLLDTIEMKEVEEEPTSNDSEEAVNAYIGHAPEVDECSSVYGERQAFKAGANWQKEQLMENAVEAVIHPYDAEIWVDKDLLSIYDDCQRVKLIIIKESKL